ncbi:MAG: AAA family ATPase [Candidatus Omnitrophica bacterium]|nr:AAA family ATPase [Candidatus Omnitrophota bacterium]
MYFKRLEIFGFKSFAEKTVLNFEPGVTAVVGPNGCGKSNVFDAIRWVLGEQSVKQLRGGEMQDVIFNGTDSKLALGFAEVSVTFSNTTRTLQVNADEVVVTRRLFRSGESEYLINKEPSRLKDITELFMGTGVGAESYSLVQQGRVDLVVSAKAEDRRMIFDEAAGITKYKSKKREAQGKLKETDDNLLRINDIVVEVKRQIGSIERQAQKAQRYKQEFEKLKGFEQVYALYQLDEFKKEKAALQFFLAEVQNKETDVSRELEEYRQIVERESLQMEELEARVQEVREQDIKIDSQIDLANRQVGFDEERLLNLDENEKRISSQKIALAEKCRAHQEKIDELERTLAAFNENVATSLAALNAKKEELGMAALAIEECQNAMRKDEEAIFNLSTRQMEISNSLTEVMKETQGFLARRRRLDTEQVKVLGEKEAIDRRLAGVSQGIVELIGKRASLAESLGKEKDIFVRQSEELNALGVTIDGLEKKKFFLISQKDFIEKMHVQYQDMPDPVIDGRFLSSSVPVAGQTGFMGKIKEVIAVDPARFENLKSHLSRFESGNLYEIICETKFIELDPQSLAAQIDAIEDEVKGLVIEKQVKTAMAGDQSKLIERIQADIHTEERRLSVCEAQQSDIALEAGKIANEIQAVALEVAEVEQGLSRLKESDDRLQSDLKQVEEETGLIRTGLKGREEALMAKRREREGAAVACAQMESELNALKDKEKSWHSNLDMFIAGIDGFREELSRLDVEVASYGERRLKLNEDIEQLQLNLENLMNAKNELRGSLSRFEAEEQDVSQRLSSVRTQITMMEKEIADNREMVHERAMKVQQIEYQERSVRERLQQKYSIDLAAPVAAATPGVAMDLQGMETAAGQEPVLDAVVQPGIDVEALKLEIQTLAKRCESYGGVNLMAIEEFEELKNRFQFLTKQQSDLLTAKDLLEQTIRKINKTTRQLFTDTFIKVNEQFRTYFRMLFNGGEAQLVLLDPENALESGIEIIARPPGKKLQTISLMSGGEKTMTAIALIFAVFKVNPSPFCVLDEIDAALDEANVDRFAAVLKEFAKIAQFIVITHNKKTIANADVMYGITMQQTGVSRVVSVKFAEKVKEAAGPAAVAVEAPVEASVSESVSAAEVTPVPQTLVTPDTLSTAEPASEDLVTV